MVTTALVGQRPVGIIKEAEPLQVTRDGSPANRPYAAACSSLRNSTGTIRSVRPETTLAAITLAFNLATILQTPSTGQHVRGQLT